MREPLRRVHDGILRLLLMTVLGIPIEHYWSFPFALCGVSVVELGGAHPRLRAHNLAEHMDALAGAAQAEKEASEFADIHFAFDRFDLRPAERQILDMHAKWLVAHPEFTARIEGNCDERGTVEYNMALGQRRAASAMTYLVDLGVAKNRLSTISYGKERPLDPGHNEEAWAKNRRDHFSVTRAK